MGLTYADAVLLLGGRQSKVVSALDALAGGALLAASAGGSALALSLFDAKGELARLSGSLVTGLSERVSGLSRFERSERLAAAHAIVVLSAYFEELAAAPMPFAVEEMRLSTLDQLSLAGSPSDSDRRNHVAAALLRADVPLPGPDQSYEATLEALRACYRSLSGAVAGFVRGLAIWDGLNDTEKAACTSELTDALPARALVRYEDRVRQLALDCPEVGLWLNLVDHQATRVVVRQGFDRLEQTLLALATGRLPDERRDALTRAYRADLDRAIASTGDIPDGLRLPSLLAGYVTPRFRAVRAWRDGQIAQESWWDDVPVRNDFEDFLAGFLTTPAATEAPLLVLGQPGSGKSVLTRMLAGSLPAGEFLVVRVVLRDVPADADLQAQIEDAIRAATGEELPWPALARTADGALGVVILDGFDELLQATGVSQSDYLQRVAAFQQREADQGRPVAVLVTTRTAVADRARPVTGMVAVRLEPFGESQVARWLEIWNGHNALALADREPLTAETLLAHGELASQPLLLLMLALYDAESDALRSADQLHTAELYERLLIRFVERELEKAGTYPDDSHAIEQELTRLAVVAFAMFNRGQQWVTGAELDADLAALLPEPPSAEVPGRSLRARLTAADVVVGRFFFVHEARATRDDTRLRTYEFLHATFGEYLVARLVTRELDELIDAVRHAARRGRFPLADDALLYALLSFAPLTSRATTAAFVSERLRTLDDASRQTLRDVLLGLFRRSLDARHDDRHRDYQPWQASLPARCATYSANLVLLTVLAAGEVTSDELFPDSDSPVDGWRDLALLWRSQVRLWGTVAESLAVERGRVDDRRQVRVRARANPADRGDVWILDPRWFHDLGPSTTALWFVGYQSDEVVAGTTFAAAQGLDTLVHALAPLFDTLGTAALNTFVDPAKEDALRHYLAQAPERVAVRVPRVPVSGLHALLTLWLVRCEIASVDELIAAYVACLPFAHDAPLRGFPVGQRFRDVVTTMFVEDQARLPPDFIAVVRNYLDLR
ncbi:NACHT domain-containing protein [Cryptosporangium aurantiacum]|uniref:AAA+ ATPase domain-containing protein n=1 Tax=Cryptosporangium aurantiacum TaxID=134849 RepID=A0A1M7R3D4_9ACTN|nr:ATP-binding protein [Cryptosporangium aurantiacum]SHN39174.1 hypothetical protein SAMN05443668_106214 [Cryptosporangium aurantiacum]